MKNSRYWSLTVALLLGGCSGNWNLSSDRVRSTFHEVVPARSAHSVRVTNISGKINVLSWDRRDVEIDALLHAPDVDSMRRLHVDVLNQGDAIRVATRYGDEANLNVGRVNNGYIDYTIHVPRTIAVTINNVSGTVAVSGIHNDVRVRNVSGSNRCSWRGR